MSVSGIHVLTGYTFFSSNLWSKFSQCYYIVTRECHISPESLCRELPNFTHYFDLVAMAMLLALWVAKHGNGRNSKRNIYLTRFLVQILSRCVSTKLCLRIFNYFFKFELRHKITRLAGAWLPWQPYKNLET